MNIIVTGFEPFLDNDVNPTLEVLKLLPKMIEGHNIIIVKLPVLYDQCFEELKPYISKYHPDIIINLGLAPRRRSISLERVAINISNSIHGDNAGIIKIDEAIIEQGENAYFSTLPLRKIYDSLNKKEIPVEISNTAGLYICNNLMYHVLHHININNLDTKAGFIHVPFMEEQLKTKSENSLKLATILEGVIDSIKATI